MASDRLRYLGICVSVALVAFAASHLALDRLSRAVEADGGYLWKTQEWMQLLTGSTFRGRGEGRVLLVGSSEGREGFLSDVVEEELPELDALNNSISNLTLGTLVLSLRFIERAYGAGAVPDKLVVGVTPWFLMDDPPHEDALYPQLIDRYSPFWTVLDSVPPTVTPKGSVSRIRSAHRFLTHQSGRYRFGVWGAARGIVTAVAPQTDTIYALRLGVVPSMYHHLEPLDQAGQLDLLRASPRPSADPTERLPVIEAELDALRRFAERRGMELYFVNLPQSTWLIDEYFGVSYDVYLEELARLTRGSPYLDLARFLADDEFYDILHPDRGGAERLSRRVARFVREVDGAR